MSIRVVEGQARILFCKRDIFAEFTCFQLKIMQVTKETTPDSFFSKIYQGTFWIWLVLLILIKYQITFGTEKYLLFGNSFPNSSFNQVQISTLRSNYVQQLKS